MQYRKTAAIFAVSLATQAIATGWTDYDAYSAPSNTDNKCTPSQQEGYDWSGLDDGSFSSYGSNKFSGFSCGSSFGKRDLLTKRSFQSKCIQGSLDEQPSMSCDSEDERMSIDEFEISHDADEDADVECEYSMPDGSTCRETHSCKSGGSIVKNSQCGGARSVTFKPGRNAPSGCSIGVHSVGFNCDSAPSSVPATSAAPYTSSTIGIPGYTARTSSSAGCGYGEDCESSVVSSSLASTSSSACGYGEDCYGSSSSSPATTSSAACGYGEDCEASVVPSGPATTSAIVSSSSYACYGNDCSSTVIPSSPASESAPCYGEDCGSSSVPATSATEGIPGYTQRSSSSTEGSPVTESSSAPATSETEGIPGYTQRSSSSTEGSPVTESSAPAEESSTVAIPGYTDKSSSKPVASSAPIYGTGSSYPIYGTGVSSTQGIPGYTMRTSSVGTAPVSSTEGSPVSSTATHHYPEPSCPGVVPKCLKTWLHLSECKDNSDSDCFCKNEQLTKQFYGCLDAWANDEEKSAAASYFMGLCAPHVPENPGIITNCPSHITPIATPATTAPASSAPVYESSPVESASVPAEESSTEGSPVGSSSAPAEVPKTHTFYSTAEITVTSCGPEVTDCPASSTVVEVTSTPVSYSTEWSPAQSSAPADVPTGSEGSPAPPAYTPEVPKTHTFYSTAKVTVTSCGPEVKDCPASSTVVKETSTPVSYSVEVPATVPAYPSAPATAPASPTEETPETPYSPEQGHSDIPAYPSVHNSAPAEGVPAPSGYPAVPSAPISAPVEGGAAPSGYPAVPTVADSTLVHGIPATTAAPSAAPSGYEASPVTTVTYSSSVVVPHTYSEGPSAGYDMPDSSYTTHLVTTITVPQVAMTTVTLTQDGQETTSVGLGAGSPSPAPAYPTADAVPGYAAPSGSQGFGTQYVPKPTGSGAPIEQIGNAGVKVGASFAGLAMGAVAVVMAL